MTTTSPQRGGQALASDAPTLARQMFNANERSKGGSRNFDDLTDADFRAWERRAERTLHLRAQFAASIAQTATPRPPERSV